MPTRKEQKEKRRWEILNAGLNLFIKKGYTATKISDIATQAGMSTGLMFHYFESKQKLFEELIKIGMSGPNGVMQLKYERPINFFEESAKQVLGFLKVSPFTTNMFVLMSQVYSNDDVPQTVKDMLASFDVYTPTAEIIKEGQKDKTIREGDPYALALAFWCAIDGIAQEIAIHPQVPCPESEWIVDIIRRK